MMDREVSPRKTRKIRKTADQKIFDDHPPICSRLSPIPVLLTQGFSWLFAFFVAIKLLWVHLARGGSRGIATKNKNNCRTKNI
jgi:hypothetical protein